MNRPASMVIAEFEENLENCINNSALPPILIEMVLRGYYMQIREMADKQRKSENAAYEESLSKAENEQNSADKTNNDDSGAQKNKNQNERRE